MRFTERLAEAHIKPSIGTGGDAHDNSLAESINGLYKTELINPGKPWRDAVHVETETAAYLRWFNYDRLYEYCGDIPPAEFERNFYCLNLESCFWGSVSSIKVMSPDLPGWFKELEGRFLGRLVYLDAKARGDKSMPGKRWPSGGVQGGAPQGPRDMAKA